LIQQLGENETPILGAVGAGWYGVFTQNGGPSGRWKEYTPIAPLEGPSGLRQTPRTPFQPTGGQANFVITKEAKNPEAAFRLADVFYGFDSTTNSVFGVEGEDWVRATDSDVSIAGGKAQYTVLKVWGGEPQNRHWSQTVPTFRTNDYRMAQTYNADDPLERWLFEWTRDLMEPYGTTDKAVPPLVFTEEQSKLFGELKTSIDTTMDEWFANFVIGNADVDADWETYLATLNDAGLAQYLEIYQTAYDAKYK
jgi:putative aldouronate transport system substrate-binding protein